MLTYSLLHAPCSSVHRGGARARHEEHTRREIRHWRRTNEQAHPCTGISAKGLDSFTRTHIHAHIHTHIHKKEREKRPERREAHQRNAVCGGVTRLNTTGHDVHCPRGGVGLATPRDCCCERDWGYEET